MQEGNILMTYNPRYYKKCSFKKMNSDGSSKRRKLATSGKKKTKEEIEKIRKSKDKRLKEWKEWWG